jgi:hypothetical protein
MSHRPAILQLMTMDSVIAEAVAWGSTTLGVGAATGLIVAVGRATPRLTRRLIRGISSDPERMLVGALNRIDRKTRSGPDFLL